MAADLAEPSLSPEAPTAPARRGGRPSREDAEHLQRIILDIAAAMFLSQGYGATSIDAIAREARMSKRTFYHRFQDKAALFGAVVHDIVGRLRPPGSTSAVGMAALFAGKDLEEILLRLARIALNVALSSQAVALRRVLISEAQRFPELAAVAVGEGSREEAINHIKALLERECQAGHISLKEPRFAAEQFLEMVVSIPQRRALGLGTPMTEAELDTWVHNTVRLFLGGCHGAAH